MNTGIAYEYLTGKRKYYYSDSAPYALECAAEGAVLLKNEKNTLPLGKHDRVCLFGRMQKHYLFSGTGSGGRVNPPYVTNIFDSLKHAGVMLDGDTEKYYDDFCAMNPYDFGNGWTHPHSQSEPVPDEAMISEAAKRCGVAVMVIARTAGEDSDCVPEKGSYYLSDAESDVLTMLRKHFRSVCVLLNVCGIIDTSWTDLADAVLLLWQAGIEGGTAAAGLLTGRFCPSGHLPDTIPVSYDAVPTKNNFGNPERNVYAEDIYVGYRYYLTFAPQDVAFPFGFGLSYTKFEITPSDARRENGATELTVTVRNTGGYAGKATVQCYASQPRGALGKPARILCGFEKTPLLKPDEICAVKITVPDEALASYDDGGYTGCKSCLLLEKGEYVLSVGESSDNTEKAFSFTLEHNRVLKRLRQELAPVTPFERLENRGGEPVYVPAPLKDERLPDPFPEEIRQTGDRGIKLADVGSGKAEMSDFIAQLSDAELCCIVRGEGMSSPKVTPGTAAAYGGVTPSLCAKGIPTMCCTDGPSGVRMVSDSKCFAYPCATAIAASWNTSLAERMYECCGHELASYGVDILLGPGVNIHRDPLCGRNFEYFSEDPLLAGKMGAAVARGLSAAGVSGAVKHFLGNNQEFSRHRADSVISERAVREIYARPFEITVTESDICAVMTSYNRINGRWAASDGELCRGLLRDGFGFDGFVMTDWWAKLSGADGNESVTDLRGMVLAGNDIYMVTPDAETREDNLLESLKDGSLPRGAIQSCAANICRAALKSLSLLADADGRNAGNAAVRRGKLICEAGITNGKAVFNSERAVKATLRITVISDTSELTQTDIRMTLNGKSAAYLQTGGTGGREKYEYRTVSLAEGENKLCFECKTDQVRAVLVTVFAEQ